MIIQMQSLESTGLSRKIKKHIMMVVAILLILVVVVFVAISCFDDKSFQPIVYSSEDDVISLFYNNIDSFEKTAQLLNGSDIFRYLYKKTDHTCILYTTKLDGISKLSSSDSSLIEKFFKENHPYEISQEGGQGICYLSFYFLTEKDSISILYIPCDDKETIYHILKSSYTDSDVTELSKYWYCSVYNKERKEKNNKLYMIMQHVSNLFFQILMIVGGKP